MQSQVDFCNESLDTYEKKVAARQKADKVQVVISGGILCDHVWSLVYNFFYRREC